MLGLAETGQRAVHKRGKEEEDEICIVQVLYSTRCVKSSIAAALVVQKLAVINWVCGSGVGRKILV